MRIRVRVHVRGHAIRRRGCEMRAPILDQPFIAVAYSHEVKVDRYRGDDRPIRAVRIVHGKQRVGDRDIRFDEADAIVGKRRLRGGVNGLLRLGTEVLHHGDPSLQIVTLWRNEGSIFLEQGGSEFGILLNERLSKVYLQASERRLRLEPRWHSQSQSHR